MSDNRFISASVFTMVCVVFVFTSVDFLYKYKQLPLTELKQFYLIDNELYKPVNVLGCIHLQTSRKSIHSWSLCRNKIHNGVR